MGVRRNERKERDRNSRRVKEKRGDDGGGGGGREVRKGIQAAVRSGDKCLSKKMKNKKTKRNHRKR